MIYFHTRLHPCSFPLRYLSPLSQLVGCNKPRDASAWVKGYNLVHNYCSALPFLYVLLLPAPCITSFSKQATHTSDWNLAVNTDCMSTGPQKAAVYDSFLRKLMYASNLHLGSHIPLDTYVHTVFVDVIIYAGFSKPSP